MVSANQFGVKESSAGDEEQYPDTMGWPLERPECILHAKSSLDAG
jgi:hypothetical protein